MKVEMDISKPAYLPLILFVPDNINSSFLNTNRPFIIPYFYDLSNVMKNLMLKKLGLICICLIQALKINAQFSEILIREGDSWKYYDKEKAPTGDWTSATFSDSNWQEGVAEFGYGDGDEKTVISFGEKSEKKLITSLFRKKFMMTNPDIKSIELKIKCDDGAVVYINGKEVFRTNMPGGKISWETDAAGAISGDGEKSFLISHLKPDALVKGENIIAVEVHQDSPKSSDLSFDLSMTGSTRAEITRGPYLQSITPHSVIVRWRTSSDDKSRIIYGSISLTDSVVEDNHTSEHSITIEGLKPSTKYYYSTEKGESINDSTAFFITPPAENAAIPVRIWSMGDFGTGNNIQKSVRDAYYAYTGSQYTNLVLWLGDNAYPTGTDDQYSSNVFSFYKKILANSVVYSTCGNHDLFFSNTEKQTGPYFNNFTFPVNGESGGVPSKTEAYYSFNYSNIHFVCLESNVDSFKTKTDEMINWLRQDLSQNKLQWTIAYFHCPPYSKGYHDSDKNLNMIFMREKVVPVLEEFGVDLVLSGHDHDYERTYLINGHFGPSRAFKKSMIVDKGSKQIPVTYKKKNKEGAIYIVAGCAGELQQIQPSWPHPAMAKYFNKVYGSLVIDVNGNTLKGKMLSSEGKIADDFVIIKD